MSDIEAYDARVRAIRAYNQPLLENFRAWLEQSGLTEKTVKNHVDNIDGTTTLSGGELKQSPKNELKRTYHHHLMWLYHIDFLPNISCIMIH